MSPLRSTMQSDIVTPRDNKIMIAKWQPSLIRDHAWISGFFKTSGKRRIERKLIKTNKETLKS